MQETLDIIEAEETSKAKKLAKLKARSENEKLGQVKRGAAFQEYKKLEGEDPLPLREAKIKQSAQVRKAKKATKAAKKTQDKAATAAAAADEAATQAEKTAEEANAAATEAAAKAEEAKADADAAKVEADAAEETRVHAEAAAAEAKTKADEAEKAKGHAEEEAAKAAEVQRGPDLRILVELAHIVFLFSYLNYNFNVLASCRTNMRQMLQRRLLKLQSRLQRKPWKLLRHLWNSSNPHSILVVPARCGGWVETWKKRRSTCQPQSSVPRSVRLEKLCQRLVAV